MIPVSAVVSENIYTQHDAAFLLGAGFTGKAARETICRACRNGELRAKLHLRRYWFSGRAFLKWVRDWFGAEDFRLASSRDAATTSPDTPNG